MGSLDLNGIVFIQEDVLQNALNKGGTPTELNNQIKGLQDNLQHAYSSLLSANSSATGFLNNQEDLKYIINQEHDVLLRKKNEIDNSHESKKRLLELNESYRLKSADYTRLLMIIIFGLVTLAFVIFLSKALTFIPGLVFDILSVIIICMTAYLSYNKYYDITSRDNLYYNELHIEQPTPSSPDQIANMQKHNASLGDLLGSVNLGACVGSSCCDGVTTLWDEEKSKCINMPKSTTGRATTTSRPTTTQSGPTTTQSGPTTTQSGQTTTQGFETMANSAYEFNQYNPY